MLGRRNLAAGSVAIALTAGMLVVTGPPAMASSVSFTTVGPDAFTVPAGVTSITVTAAGGGGGGGWASGAGGGGGCQVTDAVLAVTPGSTIDIYVGGGGRKATGQGAGGGGGASQVNLGNAGNQVIAGGGGGGGSRAGGDGGSGCLADGAGADGADTGSSSYPGKGGAAGVGGAAGLNAGAGGTGAGGAGGSGGGTAAQGGSGSGTGPGGTGTGGGGYAGGGGGGGYGGGGGAGGANPYVGGGGAGGSVGPQATFGDAGNGSTAAQVGSPGMVQITYYVDQTITFPQPPDAPLSDGSTTVEATASSSLPVNFTTSTPAVCTVAGTTVSYVSSGSCSITATQDGDDTYAPASLTRTFEITDGPAAQTPLGNCVSIPAGSVSATRVRIVKSACQTNAGNRVGTVVGCVPKSRGDLSCRIHRVLRCSSGNPIHRIYREYWYCQQGALVLKTSPSWRYRVVTFAPANADYDEYRAAGHFSS